jgi:hypothetical protein
MAETAVTSFALPTDTAHVRLRSRQYRILKFDLGEGVERATVKVVALFLVPWTGLLLALGVPLLTRPYAYVVPPALLAFRACSRDAGGRVRLRGWLDRATFRVRRAPIVNADTAPVREAPITAELAFLVLERPAPARPLRRKARRAPAA